MKLVVCALFVLSAVGIAQAQGPSDPPDLPTLHRIESTTLGPNYGCQPSGSGYGSAALYLSKHSQTSGAPDLLFNGACGSDDLFQISTAGDDMALIADLGTGVKLGDVTAQLAFNLRGIARQRNETKFGRTKPVQVGHTYVVLLDKSDVRGLFVFTVDAYEKNQSVTLRYAVKEYQLLEVVTQSEGFDWTAPSTER